MGGNLKKSYFVSALFFHLISQLYLTKILKKGQYKIGEVMLIHKLGLLLNFGLVEALIMWL